MKLKPALFILFLTFPFFSFAQSPSSADSARMVIDSALRYAKTNSFYKDKVIWAALTDSVKKYSKGAKNIEAAMPALKVMYKMLGDFHGRASYKDKSYKWVTSRAKADYTLYAGLLNRVRKESPPQIHTRVLENGYGYIAIPSNNPTKDGETSVLVKQLQDSLTKLNPAKLKGIIVDLRANTGGNMYPMILGVGNLFNKSKLGTFVSPGGKGGDDWYIKGTALYIAKDKVLTVAPFGKVNPRIKIAVLVSPFTASSGEATAISFKGQKNAKVIGDNTAGYTTANESTYFLGVQILLATSIEADRTGHIYHEYVTPDVVVKAGDDLDDFSKDKKIIAAMKWLKGK
jgi:carboxyl-terminal processing protease